MGMAAPAGVPTGPPEPPPQKHEPVPLAQLVQRTTSEAYTGIQDLCKSLPGRGEKERKLALLKYLVRTRQRLLRLHVLAEWAKTQAPLMSRGQQLSGTLEWHDTSLRDAADQLFFLHAQLRQARAPIYDVTTAVEVLTTGSYSRLPIVIQDLRPPPTLVPSEQASALSKADRAIHARLLECELPPQLTDIRVSDGAVRMRVKDEFEVRLTLGHEGDLSKWRVLWLALGSEAEGRVTKDGSEDQGFGEKTRGVRGGGTRGLTEGQRRALAAEVERRMGLAAEPLHEMYRVLHELAANLLLDSVFRQAQVLKQGTWRDVIRLHFEKGDAGSVHRSLKIEYWDRRSPGGVNTLQSGSASVEPFRPSPSSHLTPQLDQPLRGETPVSGGKNWALKGPPSLRIELDDEGHVACSHWPVVVDPESEESALFSVAQHGGSLEELLRKALACSAHSRLLELEEIVNKEPLVRCKRSFREGGVAFGSLDEGRAEEEENQEGAEKLWVQVYGSVGAGVEVNRRSGRFVLRQPVGLVPDSLLRQLEERLNSGGDAPGSLFLELRKAALLRLFRSMAVEMELEPYAHGVAALDTPEDGPSLPPDTLLCSFPGVLEGFSFFLAISFDDFCIPFFTLLASDERDDDSASDRSEPGVSGPISGLVKGPVSGALSGALSAAVSGGVSASLTDRIAGAVGAGSGMGLAAVSRAVRRSFAVRPQVTKWMELGVGEKVIDDGDSEALLLGWGSESERAAMVEEEEKLRKRVELERAEAETQVQTGLTSVSLGAGWKEQSTGSLLGAKSKERSEDPLGLLKEWPDSVDLDTDWTEAPEALGGSGAPPLSTTLGGSVPHEEKPPESAGASTEAASGANASGVNTASVSAPTVKASGGPRFERSLTMDMVEGLLDMLGDEEEETKTETANLTGVSDNLPGASADLAEGAEGLEVWEGTTGGEETEAVGNGDGGTESVAEGGLKRPRESSMDIDIEAAFRGFGGTDESNGLAGQEGRAEGNDNGSEEPSAKRQKVGPEPSQATGLEAGQALTGVQMNGETAPEASDEKMEEAGSLAEASLDAAGALEDSILDFDPATAPKAEPLEGDAEIDTEMHASPRHPTTVDHVPEALAHVSESPKVEDRCRLAVGRRFSSLLAAANQGRAPPEVYRAALYRALAHCSLCIKHDVITRQLTSAGVAYAEEVGLRRPSFDLRAKVPGLDGGDDVAPSWPPVKVLLGGPGVPGVTIRVEDGYLGALAGLERRSKAGSALRDGSGVEDASIDEEKQNKVDEVTEGGAREGDKETADAPPNRDWLSRGDIHFLESAPEDAHIQSDAKGFEIRVKRITPSFATDLVRDLKRVWLARAFVLHLAEALGVLSGVHAGSDELEVLAGKRGVSDSWGEVTITGVGLTDVEVRFENFRTILMSVTWPRTSGGAKVSLLPQALETLEHQLEEFVNEGEVALLLDAVSVTAVPQGLLAESLPCTKLMRRAMYSPTEVELKLWSPYRARFTFRNCFTLEMRCFAGAHVWLQPVPPADPSSSRGYAQIPGFQWCVNEELAAARTCLEGGTTPDKGGPPERGGAGDKGTAAGGQGSGETEVGESLGVSEPPPEKLARFRSFGRASGSGGLQSFPSFGRQGSSGRGDSETLISPGSVSSGALKLPPPGSTFPGGRPRLTDTGGYAGMWVPWYAIPQVCRGLWPNLAVHWAVITFVECVQTTRELLTRDNEWQVLKHDASRPLLQLRCGSLAVQLSASSSSIRFKLQSGTQQESPITKVDAADLDEYFHARVLRSPHHRDRIASFVTLLALPIKTLRDFVGLIRWEKVEIVVERDRESKGQGGSNVVGEICLEKKPLPPGGSEFMAPFARGDPPVRERDPSGENAEESLRHVEGNVYYNRRKGVVDFALGFVCPVSHNRALWRQETAPGDWGGGLVGPERRFLLTWLRCSVQDESIQLLDVQGPLEPTAKERLTMLITTALDLNTRGESEGSKMQRAATAIQATLVSQ